MVPSLLLIVNAAVRIRARMRAMSASGDEFRRSILSLTGRAASTAVMLWPSAVFILRILFSHDPRIKWARELKTLKSTSSKRQLGCIRTGGACGRPAKARKAK